MSLAATFDETPTLFPMEQVTHARSLILDAKTQIQQFAAMSHEHGGLLTQAQVALLAGLSRARVNQLLDEGKLPFVEFTFCPGTPDANTVRFVPGPEVVAWMGREKSKGGRPSKMKMIAASFDMK